MHEDGDDFDYLSSYRERQMISDVGGVILAFISVALFVAVLLLAFFIEGTPQEERGSDVSTTTTTEETT